jgi:prepilin-type N-terminal cleavage/methylation domain-containing protein
MKQRLPRAAASRRTPKRPGFTLMELMAVITALAVVLGGAIVLIQFMLGISGEVRERTHTVVTLCRLAEQFRRDTHAASGEPRIAADHRWAEFDLPGGGTIRWEIDERGDLCRKESAGTKPSLQNTYRLPNGTATAFDHATARIAALRIESAEAAGPVLVVEALVERDEMFAVEEKK